MPRPPRSPSLYLRTSCPRCGHRRIVSLSKLDADPPTCNRCGTQFPKAEINNETRWVNLVYERCPPLAEFPCPVCGRSLQIPGTKLDEDRSCPDCRTPLQIRLQIAGQQVSPSVNGESGSRPEARPTREAWSDTGFGIETDEAGSESLEFEDLPVDDEPDLRLPDEDSADTIMLFEPEDHPLAEEDDWSDEHDANVFGERTQRRESSRGSAFPMHITYRLWLWGLIVLIPLTLLLVAPAIQSLVGGLIVIALLIPRFGFIPRIAFFVASHVTAAIHSNVGCPGCGESFPAVNRWFCGCGFHDHRTRHVISFKCRVCKNRLGRFNCPRCQSTIFVR